MLLNFFHKKASGPFSRLWGVITEINLLLALSTVKTQKLAFYNYSIAVLIKFLSQRIHGEMGPEH